MYRFFFFLLPILYLLNKRILEGICQAYYLDVLVPRIHDTTKIFLMPKTTMIINWSVKQTKIRFTLVPTLENADYSKKNVKTYTH